MKEYSLRDYTQDATFLKVYEVRDYLEVVQKYPYLREMLNHPDFKYVEFRIGGNHVSLEKIGDMYDS